MKIVAYIIFGVSILFTLIHLYFCFIENEKARKYTKVFCVAFLALSIIFYSPKSYLIYIGAICGAIGDFFLLFKDNPKRMFLGIVSFFIGHCFYLGEIISYMQMPNWGIILLLISETLLIVAMLWILHPRKEPTYSKAAGPGIAYFGLLGSMLAISIISAIVTRSIFPPILYIIGYGVFLTSDILLSNTSYKIKIKRPDFYIMLTYLLAEYLITIGLVFTSLAI